MVPMVHTRACTYHWYHWYHWYPCLGQYCSIVMSSIAMRRREGRERRGSPVPVPTRGATCPPRCTISTWYVCVRTYIRTYYRYTRTYSCTMVSVMSQLSDWKRAHTNTIASKGKYAVPVGYHLVRTYVHVYQWYQLNGILYVRTYQGTYSTMVVRVPWYHGMVRTTRILTRGSIPGRIPCGTSMLTTPTMSACVSSRC
jgi:hypothetical protein